MSALFDRLDQVARAAMEAAYREALDLGDDAIITEHLLLGLATADPGTARLLSTSGVDVNQLRAAMGINRARREVRRDHGALLATLGIDLSVIRDQAVHTFGADAVNRAASQARPRPSRRPLWSRISCSTPRRVRRCDSPLAGNQLGIIPRVKRLLHRADRDSRPGPVTPNRLLLALLEGNEPACERLAAAGVDLDTLTALTRRTIYSGGTGEQRAG